MRAVGRGAGGIPGLPEQGREFPGKAIDRPQRRLGLSLFSESHCGPQWSEWWRQKPVFGGSDEMNADGSFRGCGLRSGDKSLLVERERTVAQRV